MSLVRAARNDVPMAGDRQRPRLPMVAAALLVLVASSLVYVLAARPASAATTELYGWGYNANGQLGNGTTTNYGTPQKVSLPSGIKPRPLPSGATHSLAVGSNGKLYAWGNNTNGQLGNGTTNASTTPVVVSLPAGVTATAVAAGTDHSVALARTATSTTGATTGSASSVTAPPPTLDAGQGHAAGGTDGHRCRRRAST